MKKILVCIKRVIDYNVKIRIKSDESGVVTDGVKMSINPFDEIAIEEALRLKESGNASEVIIVSVGSDDVQQQLKTGQMLAQMCSYAQGTFVSKVTVNGNSLEVVREVDQGLETLEVDLPAIITTDLRLNEPRYVKLPDIMKAKKKPMEIIAPSTLDVDLEPSISVLKVSAPPPRQSGVILNDASELVAALKEKELLND